jgi:hypothetical protein
MKSDRASTPFRPLFFLFLLIGPAVFLPCLLLTPAVICLRSAWSRSPTWAWRTAVVITLITCFLLTGPTSPLFIGLDWPLSAEVLPESFWQTQYVLAELTWAQMRLVNASLIAILVCFPTTLAVRLLPKEQASQGT